MMSPYDRPENALAANPLLMMWSMPWLIAHSWMAAWISAGTRKDAVERNSDPGQIPVPPVHQDSHDKEIFA